MASTSKEIEDMDGFAKYIWDPIEKCVGFGPGDGELRELTWLVQTSENDRQTDSGNKREQARGEREKGETGWDRRGSVKGYINLGPDIIAELTNLSSPKRLRCRLDTNPQTKGGEWGGLS